MYECPNCGGNIRFDIPSQQLACSYCNVKFNPYEITKEHDAEESEDYEVTVFTCSQCGGEIYSTDNTAAGFCSFCGASTILDSRISREKRPKYIIPFSKTKEDCKKAYSRMIKRAIFAPRELKDIKHIDGFRGIYMPYWLYDIKQKGNICLKGTKEHRSGDYIIKEHYDLSGDLDNSYDGLAYDASSSFSDNISERIAPFDVKKMQEFTPSILSGFYADSADLGEEVYEEDAKEQANRQTKKYLKKQKEMRKYSIEKYENLSGKYHTKCEDVESAMFPVWFLSYRNNDRVAYATVNGQTGKVVADLPVDIRKYLIGSLILAIPIFFLLNMFFTFRPSVALTIVVFIAMLSIILHAAELRQIVRKDGYLDDKGILESRKRKNAPTADEEAAYTKEEINTEKSKQFLEKLKSKKTLEEIFLFIIICLFILPFAMAFIGAIFVRNENGMSLTAGLIIMAVGVVAGSVSFNNYKKIDAGRSMPGFVGALAGMGIAVVVLMWNPVSDLIYYVAAVIAMIAIFFTLYDLICYYNILATRKLPQFDYRGGDDNA